MERTRTTRRSRRGAAALLAAVGLVVSACGSDSTANAPAGAKENAVGDAVCYDWPNGTVAKPCAIDLKGPGGGRIFYDAGTPQPWGRFLEVAPQNWNPTLNGKLYECPGSGMIGSSCDSANDSIPKATGDWGPEEQGLRTLPGAGFVACSSDSAYEGQSPNYHSYLSAAARTLSTALGAGRENTRVLLSDPACTTGTGEPPTAFQMAANYRGGDLSDWYVPSKEELDKLWAYPGRNGIGGFPKTGSASYFTSSTADYDISAKVKGTGFFFRWCTTDRAWWTSDTQSDPNAGVRPIRAF